MGNKQSDLGSHEEEMVKSECPVNKNEKEVISECPITGKKKYKNPNQYNVYGELIDPKNNMNAIPNQEPCTILKFNKKHLIKKFHYQMIE
jgi:hypothetical protein